MRPRDNWTPNVDAARTHEKRSAIDPLPANHGITDADISFRMAGDDEHDAEECWACMAIRSRRWAG